MSVYDIVLANALVVTMDDERRIIEHGAVAIKGNRIAGVGGTSEFPADCATRYIDCSGQVIIPGLVDAHNHLFQCIGRGLGDGMALWKWLSSFMLPIAAEINADEAESIVRLAAYESLSSGTTTIIDNHYAPSDAETVIRVAQAIEDVGMRGVIAQGVFGPFSAIARDNNLSDRLFKRSIQEELGHIRDAMLARQGKQVSVWPSPINMIYNELELVEGCIELAREFNTKWQTHVSEAEVDPEIFLKAYGARPLEWLAQRGLLDQRSCFAHAIWLDEQEIELAGTQGCAIAHNPMSNQYLASGAMPLRALREAGATIGLGADGAAGHLMDMFQIMRQMIYVQRLHTLSPEASHAHEAFEMATVEGARLAGIDAGQLLPGKLADIAVVSLDAPHLTPCFDVVANLVYCASGRDVTLTVVNGKVVYDKADRSLQDTQTIMEKARHYSRQLVERLEIAQPA